jgi:L-arabinose isomerase
MKHDILTGQQKAQHITGSVQGWLASMITDLAQGRAEQVIIRLNSEQARPVNVLAQLLGRIPTDNERAQLLEASNCSGIIGFCKTYQYSKATIRQSLQAGRVGVAQVVLQFLLEQVNSTVNLSTT